MVKIRLMGTPEDIRAFADYLKRQPQVCVLSRSSERANRGGEYKRIYIEAELHEDLK